MNKYLEQEVLIRNSLKGIVKRIDIENKMIYILVNKEIEEFSTRTISRGAIKFVNPELQKAAVIELPNF